jgi:catechol 2,3-dioxygenase-like lactoylglutathione lyase family enzyme
MRMSLQQVALSVVDLPALCLWYEDVLGLLPAGGGALSSPQVPEAMDVPNQAIKFRWMIDRQEGFQLELIKQERPAIRLRRRDWSPSDIGYVMMGFHVGNFDETIRRARLSGCTPSTDPIGNNGQRRVCLRDPEGNLVELLEDDVRSNQPGPRRRDDSIAVFRFVRLSVPSLDHALAYYRDILKLEPGEPVHERKHESLWGLENAERLSAVLWADDVMLELVEYITPKGKSPPADHRLTDQGILNIGLVFRSRAEFNAAMRLMRSGGAKATREPAYTSTNWAAIYFYDTQGISMELSYVSPDALADFGFVPKPYGVLIEHAVSIRASKALVWRKITNPHDLPDWLTPYFVRTIEEGADEPYGLGSKREIYNHHEAYLETVVGWQPMELVDIRRPDTSDQYDYICRTRLKDGEDGDVEVRQTLSLMFGSTSHTLDALKQSELTARFSISMENALKCLRIICENHQAQNPVPMKCIV